MSLSLIITYLQSTFTLNNLKLFLSSLFIGLSYLVGGFDVAGKALLGLICLDFILGVLWALHIHNFNRKKFFLGILKVVAYLAILCVGNLGDLLLWHTDAEWGFKNAFAVFLGVNEMLSSIKYFGLMGVKLPMNLIDRLEKYRDDIDVKV